MDKIQSKSSKEGLKETYEEMSSEDEPLEEEPIEEEEPFEEESIEEEPKEESFEEPIEEDPFEEEPIEEPLLLEEEPIEEEEPFEEESLEEEPIEEEHIEELFEDEPLDEEPAEEEEPLKEIVKGKTKPKREGSSQMTCRKQKRVRWDPDLISSATTSSTGSVVTNPSIMAQKAIDVTSLFVGSLPLNMDTSRLVELFQPFGSIANARVIIDKNTCISKGFGFVNFVSPVHAARAMKCMNGYKIGNHIISVKLKEVDESNLIVEDLPPGVDACRLSKMFSPFGHITDAVVKAGFGFVKFTNAEDAAKAIVKLDRCQVDGHSIHVRVFGTSHGPKPGLQFNTNASKEIDMANLYVAHLPQNFKTDSLIQLFIRFGSIENATVVIDKNTGLSRGYGLVKFADVAHAAEAMKKMNGYVLEGKQLYVNIAGLGKPIDEANLYVGYLPLYINNNSLYNLFERFGPIVEARVIIDEASGVSKGYGFVRFANPDHAAKAMIRMNGLIIEDKAICVRVAGVVSERAAKVSTQQGTEGLKQRDDANLYVSNLPHSLEASGLVKLFERFGPIVQTKIGKDKVTGIGKGYGFVRFSDAGHAAEAIKSMNGSMVEGKVIFVKIADPPGNNLVNKQGLLVNGTECPSSSVSMPPYLVPFVYGPDLLGSMAQTFSWYTYPGLWTHQNEVSLYGSDQWVPGPGMLGTMSMQQFPWYSVSVNGGNYVPQSDLNYSNVIPSPNEQASFLDSTKSLDESGSN